MRSVAILWIVSSCTGASDRAPRDAPCRYDSECADALVCADSSCRAECAQDRDCDGGWTCGPSGVPGVRACLPPATPLLCAYRSECPENAACLEGRCRAQCLADVDCPDGDACVEGACASPLRTPNAPADGGTSECATGARCGARCVDLRSDANHCGACGAACATGNACVEGACVPGCDPQCGVGAVCVDRQCFTASDECASAVVLDLPEDGSPASHDPSRHPATPSPGSCSALRDVWFTFDLPVRALVVAAAPGLSPAGSVGIVPGGCGGTALCGLGVGSHVKVLPAGRHALVVDFGVDDATWTLQVGFVPLGDVPAIPLPSRGATLLTGDTAELGAAGAGPCAGGTAAAYYGSFPATARSCAEPGDASLAFAEPGSSPTCGDVCAGSSARGELPMPLGRPGVIFVETPSPGPFRVHLMP